jgi:N-glycosylase/DNA lyase
MIDSYFFASMFSNTVPRKVTKDKSRALEQLRHLFSEREKEIRRKLVGFSGVEASEMFYELAFCLLTPQSKAEHCDIVIKHLRDRDFLHQEFDAEPFLHHADGTYVRFHRTKAKRLRELKAVFPEVLNHIMMPGMNSEQLREYLVRHVNGVGYKEATHFLRNIGRNSGLAILDRHILRNLVKYGVIKQIPRTLTRRKYLEIERSFTMFSMRLGISVDELDLLFWSLETGKILK